MTIEGVARTYLHAPQVTLRLLAETPIDTNDLRNGQIDLEISATEPSLPEIHCESIGHGQLVVAVRPEHPLISEYLTIDSYTEVGHIIVSRRGRLHDQIDDALAAHGLTRRVVAAVPTSTAALHYVRETDLVVAVPKQICHLVATSLGLHTLPLPLVMSPVPLNLAWHHRYDTDKAHAWLRGQVRAVLQAIIHATD